jgi:hypothetical protein
MEMAKIGYRKIMSWTYPGPILKYTRAHIKIYKRTKSGLQMCSDAEESKFSSSGGSECIPQCCTGR